MSKKNTKKAVDTVNEAPANNADVSNDLVSKYTVGVSVVAYPVQDIALHPDNPRVDADFSHITRTARDNGIEKPIIINESSAVAGNYGKPAVVLQGNLRTQAAIALGLETIPAMVIAQVLPRDVELKLLNDHNGEKNLTLKYEAYLAAKPFFKMGLKPGDITMIILETLNSLYSSCDNKIIEARKEAEAEGVTMLESQIREIAIGHHRGTMQHFDALSIMPEEVAEEFKKKCLDSGYKTATQSFVKKLAGKWRKQIKASVDASIKIGTPILTSADYPQEYVDEFNAEVLKKQTETGEEPKERAKHITLDELKALLQKSAEAQDTATDSGTANYFSGIQSGLKMAFCLETIEEGMNV